MGGFDHTLAHYRRRVERAFDRFLPGVDAAPARLHEAMRYATLSGKRVRAVLVYGAGVALGADEAALDAPACAVELVHAYSLVHDDLPCMDDDDLRRGKPTCHRAYDEATAVLVGDALQSLAFEILAADPALAVPNTRRIEMIHTLAQAIGSQGMAGGQAIDLQSVGRRLAPSELEDMHRRKTGALIAASVRLGALAAPADAAGRRALDEYAACVGLGFQIIDDILDIEGTAGTLGKNTGKDQARNKPTYPAELGLDEARARARRLHSEALESLAPLGDNGAFLSSLAGLVFERTQ